jgi:hypothetical protein
MGIENSLPLFQNISVHYHILANLDENLIL